MDHKQMEGKLQEAYEAGFREGGQAARASEDARTSEMIEQKWRQAVEATLEETKGIGSGRKELFLERLNRKLKGQQEPKKLK